MNAQVVDQAIQDIQKAISSVDVSGLLLVREDLQSEMAIMAPTDTPLRNRLNRIQGNGKAHSWYRLVPTSAAEGLFLGTNPANGFFEKGGLPGATTPSYKYLSAPYTSLGDVVAVTFFDQMAGATYTDVKKHQIKVKMLNVALMEEWAIINGDSSVGAGLQYDGLLKQTVTNTKDLMGVALSLSDITDQEREIVNKGGKPQCVVAGYREVQRISELVLGSFYRLFQAGAGSMADVPAGVSVTRWTSPFGTVDIIGSRYLPPDGDDEASILVLDDKTVLEDGNAIQMVDLMPLSAIDLALLQSAYRTLVAEFTVLQITCEAFQAKITGAGLTEPV
jgi:hypothetical protein